MADLTFAALRRDGEAFMEALSREQHLALAGHKPNADLRPIYDRFGHVLGPAALDLTRDCRRRLCAAALQFVLRWLVDRHHPHVCRRFP